MTTARKCISKAPSRHAKRVSRATRTADADAWENATTALLGFIADASHREWETLRKHYRLPDAMVLGMFRLGWVEYHSAVTWSVRVTAAGRSELQRRRAQ